MSRGINQRRHFYHLNISKYSFASFRSIIIKEDIAMRVSASHVTGPCEEVRHDIRMLGKKLLALKAGRFADNQIIQVVYCAGLR